MKQFSWQNAFEHKLPEHLQYSFNCITSNNTRFHRERINKNKRNDYQGIAGGKKEMKETEGKKNVKVKKDIYLTDSFSHTFYSKFYDK